MSKIILTFYISKKKFFLLSYYNYILFSCFTSLLIFYFYFICRGYLGLHVGNDYKKYGGLSRASHSILLVVDIHYNTHFSSFFSNTTGIPKTCHWRHRLGFQAPRKKHCADGFGSSVHVLGTRQQQRPVQPSVLRTILFVQFERCFLRFDGSVSKLQKAKERASAIAYYGKALTECQQCPILL